MNFKGKEITEEMLKKASECKNVEELLKLAKENGMEVTAEEAEAFLDEMGDIELDETMLDNVAGGEECYTRGCEKRTGSGGSVSVADKNREDN